MKLVCVVFEMWKWTYTQRWDIQTSLSHLLCTNTGDTMHAQSAPVAATYLPPPFWWPFFRWTLVRWFLHFSRKNLSGQALQAV